MATKKFIIEVERGKTKCKECPFQHRYSFPMFELDIDCDKYNLATMKIKELKKKV